MAAATPGVVVRGTEIYCDGGFRHCTGKCAVGWFHIGPSCEAFAMRCNEVPQTLLAKSSTAELISAMVGCDIMLHKNPVDVGAEIVLQSRNKSLDLSHIMSLDNNCFSIVDQTGWLLGMMASVSKGLDKCTLEELQILDAVVHGMVKLAARCGDTGFYFKHKAMTTYRGAKRWPPHVMCEEALVHGSAAGIPIDYTPMAFSSRKDFADNRGWISNLQWLFGQIVMGPAHLDAHGLLLELQVKCVDYKLEIFSKYRHSAPFCSSKCKLCKDWNLHGDKMRAKGEEFWEEDELKSNCEFVA